MLGVVAAVTSLTVSEVFGPTIQGEGPTAGAPAMFVRLGRCNLTCSWCDTPYTWDWRGLNGEKQDPTALQQVDVGVLAAQVRAGNVGRVVVTGGEPLLQAAGVSAFVWALNAGRRGDTIAVEFETNGTRFPPDGTHHCQFNVSPKLAGSGCDPDARLVPDVLARFAAMPHVAFKFVVSAPGDLDEIDALVAEYDLRNVWIMPEGRSSDAVIAGVRTLAPLAIERGYNLSSRLHVLVWEDERGR